MSKNLISIILSIIFCLRASAQLDTIMGSAVSLDEVIVKAFEVNKALVHVPSSVIIINAQQLTRFNNASILPALNSNPGIRMEERSPGSYRLNIRGSSLRSPFGVRNVKVYYNGIPYTDPGGNTFLNQLGFHNVQSLEIIKGPGSSLYGAGTGGVLLINSNTDKFKRGLTLSQSYGSFGLDNLHSRLNYGKENINSSINFQHQKSDGYRDHTEMRRDVFTWDGSIRLNDKSKLQAHLLYGDLFYETPGALTRSEFETNPKLSRPATGINPGASTSKASIRQQSFLSGFNFSHQLNSALSNSTTLYGAYTLLKNPTIRNYERKTEPHVGGRSLFNYVKNLSWLKLQVNAGAEFQQGFTTVRVSKNKNGESDSLLTDDEINNRSFTTFIQSIFGLPNDWAVTTGISYNSQKLSFRRLSSFPVTIQEKEYSNELAPRIAVLKKINSAISVYASLSRGFSPPTTAELLPSSSVISTSLEPESGTSYELGLRGNLLRSRLYFDLVIFTYKLNKTIVQRRDVNGADFFINAGSTKQHGVESMVSWQAVNAPSRFINGIKLWGSHTWHNFHYNEFKQVNNDFTGKQLPGIPPHAITAGLDLNTKHRIYSNLTYYYNDPIALNDANIDFATSYHLLVAKAGYKSLIFKKIHINFFLAADNIFDTQYSLGNDINAAGGRYFNAAPGRNYSVGLAVDILY